MISIAIVEDDDKAAKLLESHLKTYQERNSHLFNIVRYSNAVSFLTNYKQIFDIVFMDIQLPDMDGLSASYELRKFDTEVILIFVTNMAQYAVKGYDVDALDFIVKPVVYENFCLKVKKAIEIINASQEIELVIANKNGLIRLSSNRVLYVEVVGHKLIYYTSDSEYSGTGSLSELESKLSEFSFMRCNSCYLVNPKYISMVSGFTVKMANGAELAISHPKKKAFMQELADWLGKGNK